MPTGCMDDKPVAKVEVKLAEHLERTGLGPAQLVGAAASPQSVLNAITALQGGFIRGATEAAINKVVDEIAELVRSLGEFETPILPSYPPTVLPSCLPALYRCEGSAKSRRRSPTACRPPAARSRSRSSFSDGRAPPRRRC